jgi:hypothetical protein
VPSLAGDMGDAVARLGTTGCTLATTQGAGSATGTPFITMQGTCGLQGVSVYYPNQLPSTAVAYPWTVDMVGSDCFVRDVELVNVWQGVRCVGWQRPTLDRVIGQALHRGFYLDGCYDSPRLSDVHFIWGWCKDDTAAAVIHQRANCVGFSFYRADQVFARNCFCLIGATGFYFGQSATDWGGGGVQGCYGIFTGCGADNVHHDIYIDQAVYPGLIFNGFMAESDDVNVVSAGTNSGSVVLDCCSFWGTSSAAANVSFDGNGGASLIAKGSRFQGAINFGVIVYHGTAVVSDNVFTQPGTTATVQVQATASKAIVTGNACTGGAFVGVNSLGAGAVFANNL